MTIRCVQQTFTQCIFWEHLPRLAKHRKELLPDCMFEKGKRHFSGMSCVCIKRFELFLLRFQKCTSGQTVYRSRLWNKRFLFDQGDKESLGNWSDALLGFYRRASILETILTTCTWGFGLLVSPGLVKMNLQFPRLLCYVDCCQPSFGLSRQLGGGSNALLSARFSLLWSALPFA